MFKLVSCMFHGLVQRWLQGRRWHGLVLACMIALPSFTAPASAVHLTPAPGPRLQSIDGPTYTNLDSFSLIAQFDQEVANVDAGDFTVSGTSATITSLTQGSDASRYSLTISGGDLADLNGEVTVTLAAGQDIEDLSGNPLTDLATEYGNSPVTVNNTAPIGTFSSSATAPVGGTFSVSLAFTPQDGFADLIGYFIADFLDVTNGSISNFSKTQTSASFDVTPAATGTVTIELPADTYFDEASNPNLASTPFTIEADMDAPTVTSIERQNPAGAYTNTGALTWLVTFSKRVENVDVTDFTVSGTTATVQTVSPTSGQYTAWEVYVAGGDLSSLSVATVSLGFAAGQDIEDQFARALTDTTPTGTNENTYSISRVEPRLQDILRYDPTGSTTNADTVIWDFAFSSISPLFALEPEDFVLYGTTATLSVDRYSLGFHVTASGGDLASLNDTVYIALASAQHYDEYGNRLVSVNPTGAYDNGYEIDNTAPTVVLDASTASVPGGAFTVSVEFSEAVEGFTADDLVITSGSVTSFPNGSQNRFFYPTITPDGDGDVTIDLAADSVTDTAGNGNEAAEQEVTRSDGTPPYITGVEFVTDGGSPTRSDTLTWEITVSEPVTNLNQYDFHVSGPGGTLTVTNPQPTLYVLEVSGAHIASYDGVATLQPSGSFQVYDLSVQLMESAAVVGGGPAEWSVTVDHTAPGSSIETDRLTVSGPFVARITPFEDSRPFSADDVTVTNGTITGFSLQNGTGYATIQPTVEGEVVVQMLPGSFSDLAGNTNTATSTLRVQYDQTSPQITSITRFDPTDEVTNADVLVWQVTFSEVVDGVDAADFELTGGDADLSVSVYRGGGGKGENAGAERPGIPGSISGQIIQVEASGGDIPDLDGTVTLSVSSGHDITDVAGLALASTSPTGTQENTYTLANDVTSPSVVLSAAATTAVSAPFTVAVTFDEAVNGLTTGDFVVTNATLTQLDGSDGDTVYTLSLSPLADGVVTVDLPAGAASDAAGNASLAADQYTRRYDTTAPQAVLSSTASEPVGGSFTLTVSFTEDVTGFTLDDLDIVNATASGLTGSGSDYEVEIEPDFAGTVTVDLGASVVTDEADNGNLAASQFTMTVDNEAPGLVSIEIEASATTNGDSLSWLVTFSEVMANVDASDFVVDGVTGGSVSVTDLGNGVYRVTVSGGDLAGLSGTVSLSVSSANDITDAAGNGLSSTTPSEPGEPGYVVDNIAPDVVLTTSVAEPASGAFTMAVTFTEAVSGLELSDFALTNGSASNLSGSDANYTVLIVPTSDGEVTVSLAEGVATDAAGNANTASNLFTVDADITAPGVTLASGSPDPVAGAFTLDVTFSEPVTGLELADFAVDNGSASDLAGSGQDYTVLITPGADGAVTVSLPARAAMDAAGNWSSASQSFSIVNDETGPTVVLSSDVTLPVTGSFTLSVTFNEDVTGLELDDFVATSATLSDLAGEGAEYTVIVTPAEGSLLTVDLIADAVTDALGHGNAAAETFSLVLDNTPPEPVFTLPGEETEGVFTAMITFSEDVTGFALDDLVAVNADLSDFTGVSAAEYSVVVTPRTLGIVTLSIAADVARDAAGNGNTAVSVDIEAVSRAIEVTVEVADDVEDPTEVTASASISNPGSRPVAFRVEVDVPWLDVDPLSGTIPALGELDLTITVNTLINDLEAGSYTGTITVINLDGDAIAKGTNAVSRAAGDTVVVAIPLTVTVAERRGTIQLVSTTPGGVQRDASFAFSSSDPDLDGLTLTTVGGSASTSPIRKLLGQYDVTQVLPQGWRLDSLSCSGDTDGGSVIDLASGRVDIDLDANEAIICTFANTRDEAEVRLATQRAIRNFMVRRADRILDAAPDLTSRIRARDTRSPGHFAADINGGSRMVSMGASLAGMRNHALDSVPQMPGAEASGHGRQPGADVWMSASFTALSDDRAGDGSDSAFGVLQVGADWLLSEQTLVGVMLQRDWMDETAGEIAERAGGIRGARVSGEGWLAGPYIVHELSDGVWFDALAMWGQSANMADPLGLYEDAFETDRYLLRLNLSGEWQAGQWRVRPSGSLAHFGETQAGYVDSLGIDIPEQEIAIGRFEAGPEIAYRIDRASGAWWEPSVRLTGVWDYNPAELLDEGGALVGTGDVRLDARFSLIGQLAPGASIRLETDISGLGDGDFEARTGRLEFSLSFN